MDKEGQNTNAPDFEANVFNSDSIGNRATPEYFSNVKGGKKDKEKVAEIRSKKSRKPLFITLGTFAAALIIVMVIALIATLAVHRHGSRTDEEMPTNTAEIESRAYKVLYSSGKYENAIVYLNDLIKDMKDLGVDSELIFEAYAVRARIAYQAGGGDVAIQEALRLAKEADTDTKKINIYRVLAYIYAGEGDTEKYKFYSDLLEEMGACNDENAVGGGDEIEVESDGAESEGEAGNE